MILTSGESDSDSYCKSGQIAGCWRGLQRTRGSSQDNRTAPGCRSSRYRNASPQRNRSRETDSASLSRHKNIFRDAGERRGHQDKGVQRWCRTLFVEDKPDQRTSASRRSCLGDAHSCRSARYLAAKSSCPSSALCSFGTTNSAKPQSRQIVNLGNTQTIGLFRPPRPGKWTATSPLKIFQAIRGTSLAAGGTITWKVGRKWTTGHDGSSGSKQAV